MNGHGGRSSRRDRAASPGSDQADEEEEPSGRRALKRKTARAAVNKIKFLEVSDEDYEEQEEEEEKPRRSSSRLRQTGRASKRTAVIQSSSDSEDEPSTHGTHTI